VADKMLLLQQNSKSNNSKTLALMLSRKKTV